MKSKSRERKKLEIIIEKNDGLLWGRVEDAGDFMPTPYGKTTSEVIKNLKELVRDYVANEGKKISFGVSLTWIISNFLLVMTCRLIFMNMII